MKTIDDRHIIYRTRAVQRAQFLLLSDGTAKSKINNLLQYYASEIKNKEDLNEYDETIVSDVFKIYCQNYFDSMSLATPVKKKSTTPIELMAVIDELDKNLVEEKNREMLEYIKNALTSENVNEFAKDILNGRAAIAVGDIFKKNSNDLVKIIGLYTYSKTPEREYVIREKDFYVEANGVRFKEFIVEGRNNHGN